MITLVFYDSLVEKTNCQNTVVFGVVSPSLYYLHDGNYCSKTAFTKSVPKEVTYRDYKNFNSDKYKRELEGKINENSSRIGEYDCFEKTFLLVLNKYAPIKTKILCDSHVPYMIKTLIKAIMKRTELEIKYLKNKTDINLKAYKKQRKFCSKLYKKEKKNITIN